MEESSRTLCEADPSLKILVSCHKPSVIPPSKVFLPVHVGACFSDDVIPGTVSDAQGENISSRNFTFSEMSGQYWAWKNLPPEDAEYVGQCHYRRYFCFDGRDHPKNDHAQIELPLLDGQAIEDYRLADDALIARAMHDCDAIVPQSWSVVGVPTPHGPQDTVRKHMEAYELVDPESFDLFLDVVEQRRPEYAPFVRKYLDGPTYLGYNCFILRRDLFDELCDYEFDILLAFDKLFNYHDRTPTQMRICGYLGEILFSAYVDKLRSEEKVKVGEVPLTFFFETSPNVTREEAMRTSAPAHRSLLRRAASKARRTLSAKLSKAGDGGESSVEDAPTRASESAEIAKVLVSIVVPMHNIEPYVQDCMESIAAQTHANMQVIMVDDGSTDGTFALAQRFAEQDGRFEAVKQEKSNAGEARNCGMAQARGQYWLFFDGDDLMEPTMVQVLLERALETDADVTVCRAASFIEEVDCRTDEDFGPFGIDLSRVHRAEDMRGRLFSSCVGWPWDKLFRASFVRQYDLAFQSLSSTNDAAFVFEALALAGRVAFVPDTLALHRRRAGSIEGSRNASPHNAYLAFCEIERRLSSLPQWEGGMQDECLNWALAHLRWNYRTLAGSARHEAFSDYLAVLDRVKDWDNERFEHREDRWARDVLYRGESPTQEVLVDQAIDLTYGVEDLGKLHRRVGELTPYEAQLWDVRNSVSFRVGRAITAPLRWLRDR